MKKILLSLVLAAAGALSARPAEATFILSITDGTNTATVSGATGSTLTISGATLIANGFTYLQSSSFVQAEDFDSGGSGLSYLHLNNTLRSVSAVAHTIRITAFDDGLTSPPGNVEYTTGGSFTLSNVPGSTTVDWTGGVSPTAATPPGPPYDLTPTPAGFVLSTVSDTAASNGSASSGSVPFVNSGTYTIAAQIDAVLVAGGTAALPRVYSLAAQTEVMQVPEPSTILLLATFCAPVAGVWYRRRRMAK